MTEMKSNDEILDAVYIHGTREKDAPGSRCNIPELPPDELTIATALKMLDQKDRAKDSRIQELEKECAAFRRCYRVLKLAREMGRIVPGHSFQREERTWKDFLDIVDDALDAVGTPEGHAR